MYIPQKLKNTNTWRLNNTLLNNQEITKKNQRGNKKIPRNKWQWKHDDPNLWDAAKAVLRGKFIAIQSYLKKQETRNISNKKSNLTPKAIRERRTKTPQSQQKERNYKDQVRNKWKRNEGNNSKNQWN